MRDARSDSTRRAANGRGRRAPCTSGAMGRCPFPPWGSARLAHRPESLSLMLIRCGIWNRQECDMFSLDSDVRFLLFSSSDWLFFLIVNMDIPNPVKLVFKDFVMITVTIIACVCCHVDMEALCVLLYSGKRWRRRLGVHYFRILFITGRSGLSAGL